VFADTGFLPGVQQVLQVINNKCEGRVVATAAFESATSFLEREMEKETVFILSSAARLSGPEERLVYGNKIFSFDWMAQLRFPTNERALVNFLQGTGEAGPREFLSAVLSGVELVTVRVSQIADLVKAGEPIMISRTRVPVEMLSKGALSGLPGVTLNRQNVTRCNSAGLVSRSTEPQETAWHAMVVTEVVLTGKSGSKAYLGIQNSWRDKAFLYATPQYLDYCRAECIWVKSRHFAFNLDCVLATGDSIVSVSSVGAPLSWFIFE
jgi:hypothetical protein